MHLGANVVAIKQMSGTRLERSLTLPEFILAFNIYKKIVTKVYPQRLQELDDYMAEIVRMANSFEGLTFYEYHKQFSMNAAQLLEEEGIKIDWSVRDTELYISLFAGLSPRACAIYASVSHDTHFCPESQVLHT